MNYMGIDHHKQYSHMTILDESGEKKKSGRVLNKRKEVEDFLDGIEGKIQAVIEAGRATYTMVEMMEDLGVEVKIAHPLQVKAIAQARIKTDKRDSKILAHLLRSDLIPEVHRRGKENREAQRILRHRMFYVGMQTRVKNRIRALLSKQREEIREIVELEDNLFGTRGMKVLKEIVLPESDQKIFNSMIKTIEHCYEKILQQEKTTAK